MKVLFVCTGNLCRSPMAEAMLRARLARAGCEDIEVASAGTWAMEGSPATAEALEELRARGIDVSPHRSRALDPGEVGEADLVVAMTSVHVQEIARAAPDAMERVVLLKELAEMNPSSSDGGPESRLRALLACERPEARRALDVDDPMGLPPTAYARCADDLERGIDALVTTLCG